MKIVLSSILFASLFISAFSFAAFVPSTHATRRLTSTALRASNANAIAYALEMSKLHGPTAKESRLAWEAVEEISASDNRWARYINVDI